MQQGPLWGYLSKEGAVEKYWEAGSVGEEEVGEAPGDPVKVSVRKTNNTHGGTMGDRQPLPRWPRNRGKGGGQRHYGQ